MEHKFDTQPDAGSRTMEHEFDTQPDAGSRTDVSNVVEWSISWIHSLTLDPELTLGT